jgi:hypothetical protein
MIFGFGEGEERGWRPKIVRERLGLGFVYKDVFIGAQFV